MDARAKSFRERDQPYLKWEWVGQWNRERSCGVCRIGKYTLTDEELDAVYVPYSNVPKPDPKVSITPAQVWKVLKKLIRQGCKIYLYQGRMPDDEFEKWLTTFENAEVVND